MRVLKIGESHLNIKSSPLTLLFYKQEFHRDMLGDFVSMEKMKEDSSKVDSIAILQIIWAMAKTAAYGKDGWPGFVDWLSKLEDFDFADETLLVNAMEEAAQGLFRSAGKAAPPK